MNKKVLALNKLHVTMELYPFFNNGFIIQFYTSISTATENDKQLIFPIAFENIIIPLISCNANAYTWCYSVTKTSLIMTSNNMAAKVFRVLTIGY